MNCERCLGFMILDAYSDGYETGRCSLMVWRCLNCGDLIDSQILAHRMIQKRKAVKPAPAAPAWEHLLSHQPNTNTYEAESVLGVHDIAGATDTFPKPNVLMKG
jgi:hypothetical protein